MAPYVAGLQADFNSLNTKMSSTRENTLPARQSALRYAPYVGSHQFNACALLRCTPHHNHMLDMLETKPVKFIGWAVKN